MECDFFNTILPLLGVIVGGLIGYLSSLKSVELQNDLIEEKEKRQLKREKLERTYRLAIEAKYQQRTLYHEAELFFKAHKKIEVEMPNKDSLPLHELSLMIDLYIPELSDDLSELQLKAKVFNHFFIELSNSELDNLSNEEKTKVYGSVNQSFDELEAEFKNFMNELSDYSNKI